LVVAAQASALALVAVAAWAVALVKAKLVVEALNRSAQVHKPVHIPLDLLLTKPEAHKIKPFFYKLAF
jgi:hypothetical protein